MISERMKKLTANNSAIRTMFEEGKRLAAIYGRENVYDFSLGNPNFPAPSAVGDTICDIIRSEDSSFVHGYMSNSGYESVRAAVAESLNSRFGGSLGVGNIIMTVGAAGSMNVILNTLLNPGEEVLTFAPYFLEYGNYVANSGGILKYVPANPPDFQPDPEAFRAMVTEKTKAVIINNPNNPTGVIYTAQSIAAIAAVLEERQAFFGSPIYIISDEPYRELAYDGREVPWLPRFYRNTVVGYSWSKSLSLPGERIGYLVIPTEVDDYELIFAAAAISNRVLGFVNAPSLMQLVVARCLNESVDVVSYDNNRKLLYEGLTSLGFNCVYPDGAFYMWMQTPCAEKEFTALAAKHNILMVPGSSFACPGYVRIAYCVAPETIRRSLPAFEALAHDCGIK